MCAWPADCGRPWRRRPAVQMRCAGVGNADRASAIVAAAAEALWGARSPKPCAVMSAAAAIGELLGPRGRRGGGSYRGTSLGRRAHAPGPPPPGCSIRQPPGALRAEEGLRGGSDVAATATPLHELWPRRRPRRGDAAATAWPMGRHQARDHGMPIKRVFESRLFETVEVEHTARHKLFHKP